MIVYAVPIYEAASEAEMNLLVSTRTRVAHDSNLQRLRPLLSTPLYCDCQIQQLANGNDGHVRHNNDVT